jgi:hypothetical protein
LAYFTCRQVVSVNNLAIPLKYDCPIGIPPAPETNATVEFAAAQAGAYTVRIYRAGKLAGSSTLKLKFEETSRLTID